MGAKWYEKKPNMSMAVDLNRRTYDLLRLIDNEEPIGSIRLVKLMKRRGYSIKGRTIRVTLSELDEAGLTEKVPGKGRRLTSTGRAELARGNVSGRREQIRARIASLTSQVTYDPLENAGEVVSASATVTEDNFEKALDVLEQLDDSLLGPVLVSANYNQDSTYRLDFPSSITLDGVLLTHGIDANLKTAGLVEYTAELDGVSESEERAGKGGEIIRYVDAISGENSTMDVVNLLIEAGRTNVSDVVTSGTGLLIVDNREFPLTRYQEAYDLSLATRNQLGGVVDLRRPRESGPFPAGDPGWDFASLTYSGMGEVTIALLAEIRVAKEWTTLQELTPRSEFAPIHGVRAELRN
ncbi:NrpR regulatory domain-containing protein [Haladaptatus sp. NG-SE-30]